MLNPAGWESTAVNTTIEHNALIINVFASRNLTLTSYDNLCPVYGYKLL